MNSSLIGTVAKYYDEKLETYGATAKGVDWNGVESQELRFSQLIKLFDDDCDLNNATLSDLGCGYGAFLGYLIEQGFKDFEYIGYDVSGEMCRAAKKTWSEHQFADWRQSAQVVQKSDYVVASGIFSVKLDTKGKEWQEYIYETLENMNEKATRGFAFNCLTTYSDSDRLRDHLYYASPMEIFDHCKRNFSRNVALLHDYELYEFTVLVRK